MSGPPIGFNPDTPDREFQGDFETPEHSVQGASTERRPDAISPDYLTAFTFGPGQIGDVNTEGAYVRPWRARLLNGDEVWIARAKPAAPDEWEAETLLFTVPDADANPVHELDVAFTQLGRPVCVLSRADGHIWLYYYDPFIPDFDLQDFGVGRTGRCVRDNVPDVTDSDVLVFYVNDDLNRICYRTQRDRYQVEEAIEPPEGPETTADSYLLEKAITRDNRVVVFYASRDSVLGRYSLAAVRSTLYPWVLPPESVGSTAVLFSGTLVVVLFDRLLETESVMSGVTMFGGAFGDPVILKTLFGSEDVLSGVLLQSGLLKPLILNTMQPESVLSGVLLQSGLLKPLILNTMQPESVLSGVLLQSGALA